MSERYYPWAVVVASLLLIFFSQGAMFTLAVQLKPIAADMGWSREAPSLGYSAAFFGAGVGALYFGQLSERVGMTRITAFGAVSVATGVYLASLASEPWHVWLSYGVFVGLLGNACMFTPLIANVARWFERRRGIAHHLAAGGDLGERAGRLARDFADLRRRLPAGDDPLDPVAAPPAADADIGSERGQAEGR